MPSLWLSLATAMEAGKSLKLEGENQPVASSTSTIGHHNQDMLPLTLCPVSEPNDMLNSSGFGDEPETFSIQDMKVDDSGLFSDGNEPFLEDLTSFLDGEDTPCDLTFDPIEDDTTLQAGDQNHYEPTPDNLKGASSQDLDDLLDMVFMADNDAAGASRDAFQYWTSSSHSETRPESHRNVRHEIFASNFRPPFDEAPIASPGPRHYRQMANARPSRSPTYTGGSNDLRQLLVSGTGGTVGELEFLGQQVCVPSVSSAAVSTQQDRPRGKPPSRASAAAIASNGGGAPQQEPVPTDEASVSSTSPDFPGPNGDLPALPAAQDDPYFPLPALEVILMSPEARFMHLVQSLCREFPAELRQFMLAVSGDRGITPPPPDGQVMSVKSMLELRRDIEQIQPVDTLLLERVITHSEQNLARHERILKEILRIVCHGDMTLWESRLLCGKEERRRLQEEASSDTASEPLLKRFCIPSNPGDPRGVADGESSGHPFGIGDAADDVSVTSLDSDIEPDQTDLPQAFCYPKGPDLLRSNRDVAHPHLEAPVADSVCQTQFGKVKFSVYPGIRWGRDPLRKKKRLERRLSEAAKGGEANIFICDDLLEDLDMDSSVDALLDCLTQHNLHCPKAAEWLSSRAAAPLGRAATGCRARPSTSHLIIRKMADGTPFLEGGSRAPARTMDREEFLSQLADGRMTLAAEPPDHYNQLLVRRSMMSEMGSTRGYAGPHRGVSREAELCVPGSSCASLPSQQDISLASQVAKELLNRQTRELYRSAPLRPPLKHGDADTQQLGPTGKRQCSNELHKSTAGSGERFSTGREGFMRFRTSSTTSTDSDHHWKTLMDSICPTKGRSRSAVGSERKRLLEAGQDAGHRKQQSVCGAGQKREPAKTATNTQLPTILLQSIPVVNVNCQASTVRKGSASKQPLLLPKPTMAISSDPIHGSIAMQTSGCSAADDGTFSARLSRGYDTFIGASQARALGSGSLVTPRRSSCSSELSGGLEGGRLVRLEPDSADLEVPQDQFEAGCSRLTGDPATAAPDGPRRNITEPPSPKSLQARDKILRAMVSMSDDTDDVTSMHYHRPRHCDFRCLTIGGFRVEPGGGRGRLKIIYSARKVVYEFDYPPAAEETELRQLVHIEVKFSSVIALQSSTEELGIVVCQIPTVLVGRQSSELTSQRSGLTGSDLPRSEVPSSDPRLRRFVGGDMRDSPLHLLQLTPGGCEAARRTLGRVSRRFHNMLCWPPQLDGYVPRWRLVPSSDHTRAVGAGRGCQEGSVTWLQSGGQQSCSCHFSCRSLDCPCSRASLPCGYGGSQCECGDTCANTFNALLEEGVDVETAREDTCLVQNVFAVNKPREIRRLLSDSQPCPHCHLSVKIRTVVPMQRPCPHCAKPVVFSWCQRKLRDSRNHCLVCIGCSEVNFQHCLVCKFCTRRSRPRGPCTQCSVRGEQWRSQRRYVTAEGQRFSRQLMTELKLTAADASEQQKAATEGDQSETTT